MATACGILAARFIDKSGTGAAAIEESPMNGIERLHEIMTRLRDPQKGCPWDREQTLESLKPCVLEETYELLSAMDTPEDKSNYIEELGDVLLQVMFQCVMAEQEGRFSFDDVANAISDKLVRRHPHVFGDVDAKDSATVLRNWEQIKQTEHRKESRHSALDGVPDVLPGLLKAQRTQEKAARVGFDWKDASGPMEKIEEELGELKEEISARKSECPADSNRVKEELGDLLFAVWRFNPFRTTSPSLHNMISCMACSPYLSMLLLRY